MDDLRKCIRKKREALNEEEGLRIYHGWCAVLLLAYEIEDSIWQIRNFTLPVKR
jgi:hypothetical protein